MYSLQAMFAHFVKYLKHVIELLSFCRLISLYVKWCRSHDMDYFRDKIWICEDTIRQVLHEDVQCETSQNMTSSHAQTPKNMVNSSSEIIICSNSAIGRKDSNSARSSTDSLGLKQGNIHKRTITKRCRIAGGYIIV